MPTITVDDGSKIYYEVHGQGPRTIVFAHGAAGNHMSWWQQVPHYRENYRCLTFDHRGWGASTDATGMSLSGFAGDLDAILNDAEINDLVLVAQSMGGFTALPFAAAYPDRVRGLLMADTVLGVGDEALLAELRAGFAAMGNPKLKDRLRLTTMLADSYVETHPEGVFLYQQVSSLNKPPEISSDFSTAEGSVSTSELAELKTPILFLAGTEDRTMPPALIERASTLAPNARYVGIPNTGHSVYWENPKAFNAMLDELLLEAYPDPE